MRSRVFLKLFRITAYNIVRQPELSVQILLHCRVFPGSNYFKYVTQILPHIGKLSKKLLCDYAGWRYPIHKKNPIVTHWKLEILILNTIRVRETDLIPMKSMPRDKLFLKVKLGSKISEMGFSMRTELTKFLFTCPSLSQNMVLSLW